MPTKPRPPCKNSRCPKRALPGEQFCREHKKTHDRIRQRDDYDKFYHSAIWRKARRLFLNLNPLCEEEGCNKPANTVDHIQPIREGGAPLNPENLRAYCRSHHSAKSAKEGERYGRKE